MDKVAQNKRLFAVLKGILFSYIVTAFVLLLLSFMMLKMDLSGTVFSGGLILTYIISSMVGGFFVGKKVEQKKFIWGLICGVAYCVVLILVSLMMNGVGPISVKSMLLVLGICSGSGMVGGMLS